MVVEAINNIGPSFNAAQVKTQTISPKANIINFTKNNEFANDKGMSTKRKDAIGIGIITTILAILAIYKFRGGSGIINKVKNAGRRLIRNGSRASKGGSPRNLSRRGQNPPPPPPGGRAVPPSSAPKASKVSKGSKTTKSAAASAPAATKAKRNISKSKGNSKLGQAAGQITEEQRKIFVDRLERLCKENGKRHISSHPFLGVKSLAKDCFYDKIRRASYRSCGNPDISKITGTATEKIRVAHNFEVGSWDYRIPLALRKGGKSVERISLNVRPDEKLIRELDKYLSTHADTLQAYYKTPGSFENWFTRHDPITIYFNKKAVNRQVLNDIARITNPYARETGTSVLRGRLFGKGCAWQRQVSEADVKEFFDRFENIFGESISNAAKSSYSNASTGELCAFHDVLNAITGEKFEPLIPKL